MAAFSQPTPTPEDSVPQHRIDFSPPGRWQRRGEVRAFREVPRLVVASRRLASLADVDVDPGSDEHPGSDQQGTVDVGPDEPTTAPATQEVLVVPGLGTNDISTLPLRRYLNHLGHRSQGWDLGFNEGKLDRSLADVDALTLELFERLGRPITLIGQSLGGVYVRETARNHPERVSQVITLGTPLWGPRFTAAASHFRGQIVSIEERINEQNNFPIQVPVTAFYSPRDGVVDWRSCIDTYSPKADNIRVLSTHFGMGLDPDVLAEVAQRLS